MSQITGALCGIALVLAAVFLPMAFFSGSTGVIYRQFSITIVSAMLLSLFVALMFTPSLCATMLQPYSEHHAPDQNRFFGGFNRLFRRSNEKYEIGFLSDLRRMNVAITRARKKLVVVGDSATIGAHPFYQSFLEYCEAQGLYRTAWEWQ